MTTTTLSQVAAYYRKSTLCELVKFQYHLGLDPTQDEMLVEGFTHLMVGEFGSLGQQFIAADFFTSDAK